MRRDEADEADRARHRHRRAGPDRAPPTIRRRRRSMSTPRLGPSPRRATGPAGPASRRAAAALATRMKGAASQTWTIERSSNEPSSQNTISVTAKGLGERLMASDVPAPARLPMARPARTSTTMVALRPATATTRAIERSAPAIAATGSARTARRRSRNRARSPPRRPPPGARRTPPYRRADCATGPAARRR